MATFIAFEALTVSDSSVGFTAATFAGANYALVHVEDADVRMRLDATAPTATNGILLERGDDLVLNSADEISRTRFIRRGGGDAILHTAFGYGS